MKLLKKAWWIGLTIRCNHCHGEYKLEEKDRKSVYTRIRSRRKSFWTEDVIEIVAIKCPGCKEQIIFSERVLGHQLSQCSE